MRNNQPESDTWFATFTFLDAGCAISSSQARRLRMLAANIWRWTLGRWRSPS